MSKGEALVKAAISEAPMVCFLALSQAGVRCTNPVWFSFRKVLKAFTRADMIAHTGWGCFFNWTVFTGLPFFRIGIEVPMVFQFLKILEMPAAIRTNQKLLNLSIHTLQQLFMYHLEDLVLHQGWQVVPVRITKWKGCNIHGSGRCT